MHKFRQCKQAAPAECPGCGCVCPYLCDVLSQGKDAERPLPVSYPQLRRPGTSLLCTFCSELHEL